MSGGGTCAGGQHDERRHGDPGRLAVERHTDSPDGVGPLDTGESPEALKAIIADIRPNAQVIKQHGKRARQAYDATRHQRHG